MYKYSYLLTYLLLRFTHRIMPTFVTCDSHLLIAVTKCFLRHGIAATKCRICMTKLDIHIFAMYAVRPAECDQLTAGKQFLLTNWTNIILADLSLWHSASCRTIAVLCVSWRCWLSTVSWLLSLLGDVALQKLSDLTLHQAQLPRYYITQSQTKQCIMTY